MKGPMCPMLGTTSNYGFPNGYGLDLDGMGHRSIDAQFKELREILLPLARGLADSDNHVKINSEAVEIVTSRITSVEQTVNSLTEMSALSLLEDDRLKRMHRPSPVALAKQDLGTYSDKAMAPQPRSLSGPMAQGHLITPEIHDENLIRSQAPKINNHEVPFTKVPFRKKPQRDYRVGRYPLG